MDNVDPRLIVSTGTTVRDCEGLIATPGAIDVHVHFDSAGLIGYRGSARESLRSRRRYFLGVTNTSATTNQVGQVYTLFNAGSKAAPS